MSIRDRHGRTVSYLRLSLTANCPMKCIYCRPHASARTKDDSMLTADEIETVVGHLVRHHGLNKVRLTGGEPTSRPDLLPIIRRLASLRGLSELTMTTNGLTLARQASLFAEAGLHRINVSLDSLDRRRFQRLTGVDGVEEVIAGIDAALRVGLAPLKLNTVAIRGESEQEVPELVRFAASRGLEIRFIELMPMGPLTRSWRDRFLSEEQVHLQMNKLVVSWEALPNSTAPARRYRALLRNGQQVIIGFISAVSCPFCERCDRIRLAANGMLYTCLMDAPAGNLMSTIRPRFDPLQFDGLIERWLRQKARRHPAAGTAIMNHVGG